MEEYVYAAEHADRPKLFKLGRTTSPIKRLSELQVATSVKVTMPFVYPCENNTWMEAALHTYFKDCIVRGEWYAVSLGEIESACERLTVRYGAVCTEENIATQLHLARHRKEMSQSQLAEIAGIRQATISKIENAKGGNINTFLAMAEALDMEIVLIPRYPTKDSSVG